MQTTIYFLITAATAVVASAGTIAADDLPIRPEFSRYEPMMNRSPFAVATAVAAPVAVSNFAKDLYVANAAHSPNGDLVTVASSTDKNLKLYLTTKEPVDGYSISNVEWSDRVGATKVTISKDGQFASIGFNQALVAAPLAANSAPMGGQPQMITPQAGTVPQNGFGSGMIKPAPIPMLPTPPPRVRTIIQRTPTVPTPPPSDASDE